MYDKGVISNKVKKSRLRSQFCTNSSTRTFDISVVRFHSIKGKRTDR